MADPVLSGRLFSLGLLLMISKDYKFLGKLLLLILSTAVALFLVEIVLTRKADGILVRKSNRSFGLKPNVHISKKFGPVTYDLQTNSYGMRWREVSVYPTHKLRIAFVGDSFTFGCCADTLGKSFAGVFESKIDFSKFEVLNFGVPGYGPVEEKIQIQQEILPFHPRYILLMFFAGNDFSDTFRTLDPWQRAIAWVTNRALFSVTLGRSNDDSFFDRLPYSENAQKAVDLSLETLSEIVGTCRQNNIALILVAIPFEEQIRSSSSGLPQNYLQEFARLNKIAYLDLLPRFRSSHERLYGTDHHFNNAGHQFTGEILADFFQKMVR